MRLGDSAAHGVEVVAERSHALADDGFADEVGGEKAQERVALERREADRRLRPLAKRVETLVGERVDRALARLARLLARGEVAEPREPLRLDVVLALAGPREEAAAPRDAQEVVRARAAPAHERERLVREEGEFVAT